MSKKAKIINAQVYINHINYATQLESSSKRVISSGGNIRTHGHYYTDLYSSSKNPCLEPQGRDELLQIWQSYIEGLVEAPYDPEEILCKFSTQTATKFDREDWIYLVQSTRRATLAYLAEMSSNESTMTAPSSYSLQYFLRYIPTLAPHNLEIYIESTSGFFGAIIKHKKTILNFQISDNSDVIFSVVNPGKNNQFPSFTGEAIIVDAADTGMMEKLIRMVYD